MHPVVSFGMAIESTLEVHLKDAEIKLLKADEGLIEVLNTLHYGKKIGDVPVKVGGGLHGRG